jgi:DNA-binding ferritin-like protein
MLKLAILFRAMQLFAHSAHNLCHGSTFHEDHSFFGDVYGKAEGYYDSIIERLIGLGYESHLDLSQIIKEVSTSLEMAPSVGASNNDYYSFLLTQCEDACEYCNEFCKSGQLTEGTKQLLGGIADELEVLKYKILRRLK